MPDPAYSDHSEQQWTSGPRQTYRPPAYRSPTQRSEGLADLLVVGLGRTVWAYSFELFLLVLVLAPTAAGEASGHSQLGSFATVALFCCLAGIGPVRRRLFRCLRSSSVRRSWHRAHLSLSRSGHRGMLGRRVEVPRVHTRPVGELLDVRVPVGATVTDLERLAEPLAATLQIRDVRVRRDARNARLARVSLIRHEPLSSPSPAWPNQLAPQLSLWDPIPVGVDEDGALVTLALPEHNVLLGGEPGAGKSAALSLLARMHRLTG